MTYKLRDTFLEDGFYVTQNYMNNPTYYKQFNLLGHEGLDLGHTDKTRKARTPLAGTCFVGSDKNYGEFVVIENYEQKCAIYLCHMQKLEVVNGQVVKAGDAIGEMDDTGNANGEHVHCNFVILDDKGANKYKKKEFNWGFLDLQYPRDTGKAIKFAGVEEYSIEWYRDDQVPVPEPKPTSEPIVEAPSNKELSEQMKQLQKSIDLLFEDRDLLTKISGDVNRLTDIVKNHTDYINNHMKDIKADVQEVPGKVEQSVQDSIETVTDTMKNADNVTIILPQAFSLLEKILMFFRKKS